MIIRYKKRDGRIAEFPLEGNNITLGRSPDADIIVLDERASRMHAGIRLHEGEYYLKDLQSRNGTWVNGQRVETKHKIAPGDKIRLGKFTCTVVENAGLGTDTVSRAIADEMDHGKGFGTIMREIVDETEEKVEAGVEAVGNVGSNLKPLEDEDKDVTIPISVSGDTSKPKPKISLGLGDGEKKPALKPPKPTSVKPKLKPASSDGDKPSTIKIKKRPSQIKLRPPKKD